MIRALVAVFAAPGAGVDLHHRAATGFWHGGLGLVPGAALALSGLPTSLLAAVLVAVLYWLAKERGDLRRGGTLRDGIEDTCFVALGAGCGYAVPGALAAILPLHAAALIVMIAALWRERT